MNQVKLAILSHSEPLWLEKIGKVANWVNLAILSHSEPLRWEKIGKIVNRTKLAVLSHSDPLWWEKNQNVTLTLNPNFSFWGGGEAIWSYNLRYIGLNMNAIESILVKYKVIKSVHCPSQMSCTARRWRR